MKMVLPSQICYTNVFSQVELALTGFQQLSSLTFKLTLGERKADKNPRGNEALMARLEKELGQQRPQKKGESLEMFFVYIHSPVARTFFCTHAQSHLHIFMRVDIHAWLKGHEKGVCRMSVFVLYLAFSLLMFHPSLLFLYTHLDITFLSTSRTRTTPHMHREVWLPCQVRCKHRF